MRQRWFGSTGLRVPEIAVEGEDLELTSEGGVVVGAHELPALVLTDVSDVAALRDAHEAGTPVLVWAEDPEAVVAALARPEVSAVVVPPNRRELRDLDLRRLTYG